MRRLSWTALAVCLVAQVLAIPVAGQSPSAGIPAEGSVLIVQLRAPDGGALTEEQRSDTEAVLSARLDALPDARLLMSTLPDDRLRFDLDDPARLGAIRHVVTMPGELLFVPIPSDYPGDIVVGTAFPGDIPLAPIFDGSHVEDASLASDQMGQPSVDLRFDAQAAELFDAHAATHLGERVAMVLDGVVVSAPTINAAEFDGRAQISGWLDEQAVLELVAILTGGILPVTVEAIAVCPERDPCPVPTPVASVPQAAPTAP